MGLGRFAPGAQIFRVSWLRSTRELLVVSNSEFALRSICAPFYRQSGADSAYRENTPDGTYSAYFPFGDLRDMAKV